MGAEMRDAIRGAGLRVISGAAHLLNVERADEVTAQLQTFLGTRVESRV
jgi:pimeloyl-ACP methyl ester carboxylesterase